jgi:hypothetical protein
MIIEKERQPDYLIETVAANVSAELTNDNQQEP